MNKAVFLDRDGTINVDIGYLNNPEGLVFMRGAKEGVRKLKNKGFMIFIVTNQSGIARGYFSLDTLKAINDKVVNEFAKDGVKIDGVYYCPHHPKEKCKCRKPEPKMVEDVATEYKVNLEESFFVGDKISDIKTGKNAGCKTVLIDTDVSFIVEEIDDWTQPDFVAADLNEAAKWIIKNSSKSSKIKKTKK